MHNYVWTIAIFLQVQTFWTFSVIYLFLIRLDLEMHFSFSRVFHVANNVIINLGASKRSYDNSRSSNDLYIELESCRTFHRIYYTLLI